MSSPSKSPTSVLKYASASLGGTKVKQKGTFVTIQMSIYFRFSDALRENFLNFNGTVSIFTKAFFFDASIIEIVSVKS